MIEQSYVELKTEVLNENKLPYITGLDAEQLEVVT